MSAYFVKQQSRVRGDSIKIKQIPNFACPQRISQLNFSFNDIRVIPSHISSVINLQIIDLSHNKISKIQYIDQLQSIKSINLSYNLISEVPNQMSQLVQIQNLDLSFNKIALLNNIKILKQLVEIRMIDYKGTIQINLEGNQILKKKGCKQIYNKWLHPSIQDYKLARKIHQDEGYIHLTKKRNSKSLQLPIRDASALLTQRTHLVSQKIQEKQLKRSTKHQQKNNSVMKNSIQITQKLSPNFINSQEHSDLKQHTQVFKSQILNSFQNISDLSKINEQNVHSQDGNLGEWFCSCIDELNDLRYKFQVVSQNEDIKRISCDVKQRVNEQSKFAKDIIQLCLRIIKQAINNSLGQQQRKKLLKQIELLDNRIKSNHFQIIKMLKETPIKQNLSIKLYKMWVFLYRKLKMLLSQIPNKIALHQQNYQKQLQIQQLVNISPDKQSKFATNQKKKQQSNAKISPTKDKLNQLLFSNKSQCLLLSEPKQVRSNSQKKLSRKDEQDQCENCLMLKWLNAKGKEQINSLGDKLTTLQKQRSGHIQLIKNLQKFKEKYMQLADKQQLIIGQLQYLTPSTYQNFLLQQAKTIEYMLNTADLVDYNALNKNSVKDSNSKTEQMRQYTSKQIYKDKQGLLNTRLSSSKNGKMSIDQNNKVSEFSVQGKKGTISKEGSNTIKGSSYFKNKNIVTTINHSNDDPKTQIVEEYLATEENKVKKEQGHRQEVVVSQFNSQINSRQNTSSKNKNVTFQNFYTENNHSKEMTNQINLKASEKQKLQNDIILISQGSQIKNMCLQKLQTLKMDKKQNKNKMLQYLKSQQFNNLLRDKIGQNQNVRSYKLQRTTSFNKQNNSNYKGRKSFSRKHSKKMNSQLADKQNIRPIHHNLKRNRTTQQLYEDYYHNNVYIPMESQQADNYKKYVKYHLRNNIMEILFKKNTFIDTELPQKYLCGNKNKKLINKKNSSTQRSNFEQQVSKRSEINRTIR